MNEPVPARAPQVCGALGKYDRQRVERMAATLDPALRVVHEDEGSILLLDREPLRWEGDGRRGLAWIEGLAWRGGAGNWREAARKGACGLVLEGRRRYLHSSVNALGPVYWSADRGGAYFASRVDPLAQTAPRPLSVDWDAWASILVLRFPAGERTPFAEIRRLEPFSVLARRWGRFGTRSPAWPLLGADPRLDGPAAAELVIEALREQIAAVEGPVTVPLSGGRDSRMVACLLAEAGKATAAITVSDDEGDSFEEDLATPVAATLGLPHERLRATAETYPANWAERALAVEHQFVDHAWLVPLAQRVADAGLALSDGIAIDTVLLRGSRFFEPGTLDLRRPRQATHALFDGLRHYGKSHLALAEPLHAPLLRRSRDLLVEASKPFEGDPSQTVLAFYRTRTARGVSSYTSGLLGGRARMVAPGAAEAVARAALMATPEARDGDALYARIFDRLNPEVGALPSTSDTPRRPPHLPRLWRSEPALAMHRELLADGPLAPHLSAGLRDWLASPQGGELSPDLRLGMEAISLFHSWCRRYGGLLKPIDVADLRG
jgi:Asparagine synthase